MNGFRKQRAILLVHYGSIVQENCLISMRLVFTHSNALEKYLKALLQRQALQLQKTHDLLALKELCLPFAPELELYSESLAYLNQFAVVFRYPGESASREQAKRAIKAMKQLRLILRQELGLPVDE